MENKYRHTNTTVSLINYHLYFVPDIGERYLIYPMLRNDSKNWSISNVRS